MDIQPLAPVAESIPTDLDGFVRSLVFGNGSIRAPIVHEKIKSTHSQIGSAMQDDLEKFAPATDLPLDTGIKPYVLALRSGGIETFESCEGGEGHTFPVPTIRFSGAMAEGFKAFGVARELGLPVSNVRLSYSVNDGFLTGPWWEMTFTTTAR
jgi:hypothetical protein